ASMTRGRSNCLHRSSPRRRSDTPRTGRHLPGACRRPRSTCSQQIRAESRSIPPTASEGRRRDSNSRASVPSDYLAPCYQYVSSAVNKYVVYTISREYPLGPHHPVHGSRINRTGLTPSDSLQPGQKPHEAARNPKVRLEREVDVLVIGAGPTGSAAAKHAARGGADVLLVDKRPETGTPVRQRSGCARRSSSARAVARARSDAGRDSRHTSAHETSTRVFNIRWSVSREILGTTTCTLGVVLPAATRGSSGNSPMWQMLESA